MNKTAWTNFWVLWAAMAAGRHIFMTVLQIVNQEINVGLACDILFAVVWSILFILALRKARKNKAE